MGLLTIGTPLDWSEAKKEADRVRKLGIEQFIKIYHKVKDREKDSLLWGDEIEYMVLELDDKDETVRVCLRAQDILAHLKRTTDPNVTNASWSPEYARYMLESCPVNDI